MTALSSLIGGIGGGGHPYPSGVPIIGLIPDAFQGQTSLILTIYCRLSQEQI